MTDQTLDETATNRRAFLRRALLGGAGVAAVVATARSIAAPAQTPAAAAEPPARGYRLTPHIRAYYRTADL